MASDNTQPAKLTRPTAKGLLHRDRLFRILDGALDDRCVWVSGPGGSGKTSLVSSWLTERKHKVVWYQVDSGDADPATLFHYLHLSAKSLAGRKRIELPRLTAEFLPNIDLFVRRFFEAFFSLFKAPFALVFDNYQEANTAAQFHSITTGALRALPRGMLLLCISREEPPPAFARWRADANFLHIGWDDLRFTDDEARGVLRLAGADEEQAGAMNAFASGWAAGLRLLLRARSRNVDWEIKSPENRQSLFEYFAAEVFKQTSPAVQDFLLKTALLPVVTAETAQEISSHSQAREWLAWLHRNRLFTDRRMQAHDAVSYEYHPLFRAFLLERARSELGEDAFVDLRRRSAVLLENTGQIDAAAELWRESRDWPALRRVVCEQASVLLAQGRIATLEDWIAAMPDALSEHDAWLLYWRGVCRSFRDPFAGRMSLEQAYGRFLGQSDIRGAFLALAHLIESYFFAWVDAKPLDRWIAEFEQLLELAGGAIPLSVEVPVLGACIGVMYRRPDHPMLPALTQRAETLSRSLSDTNQWLTVAPFAILSLAWTGELARARILCDEMPNKMDGDVSAWSRIPFELARSIILWQEAEHEAANGAIEQALTLVRRFGMPVFEFAAHICFTQVALSAGDIDAASRALDAGRPHLNPARVADVQHYRFWRFAILLLRGKIKEAVAAARMAVLPELDAGSPYLEASFLRMLFGQTLMLGGEHAEAREHLAHVLDFGRRMPSDLLKFPALLALAWSYMTCGDDDGGLKFLREGLAIGSVHDYKNAHSLWIPSVMSQLCAWALEAGIETDYVKRLIRRRGLRPPSIETDQWPWPISIHTLGRFSLIIDERPYLSAGKGRNKPLELLQAVIAHGGRGVDGSALIGQLWPDLDGDAARNALDVVLHRLRKLLGRDDVLVLRNGQLFLDSTQVWVDAWAFERLCVKVEQQPSQKAAVEASARRLLRLYLGHFLAGEEAAWAIGVRERLRSKFVRSVSTLGKALERESDWDEAALLYHRGIELDPLAEQFHVGLMQSYRAAGRIAEALDAYRRCRDLLSITLGIAPSAATQAVYRALKQT